MLPASRLGRPVARSWRRPPPSLPGTSGALLATAMARARATARRRPLDPLLGELAVERSRHCSWCCYWSAAGWRWRSPCRAAAASRTRSARSGTFRRRRRLRPADEARAPHRPRGPLGAARRTGRGAPPVRLSGPVQLLRRATPAGMDRPGPGAGLGRARGLRLVCPIQSSGPKSLATGFCSALVLQNLRLSHWRGRGGTVQQQLSENESGLPSTGLQIALVVAAAFFLVGLGLTIRGLTYPRP